MKEAQLFTFYRDHLVDDVLPWWFEHGPDDDYGGVLTCWDNQGSRLVSRDKYTWSQGRWAWLMARTSAASEAGLLPFDASYVRDLAEATGRFIRDHAILEDGTTAFVTNHAGHPMEPVKGRGLHTSVFSDFFAALGFAGLAQVSSNPDWAELAGMLLNSADARVEAGDFRSEPYPVPSGYGSFALPMISIGVAEQVFRATGSRNAADIVVRNVDKIEEEFRFGSDIAEMPTRMPGQGETLIARHRTPGHVLEALWFIHHAADLFPSHNLASTETLAKLAANACEIGWDNQYGGIFRFVDEAGGEPHGQGSTGPYESMVNETWSTKLWWPHIEAVYTTALLSMETGRHDMKAWHNRLHQYTFDTFPQGDGKEWVQIRQRDGMPLEKTVALPVKDPFHIARALLLMIERLDENVGGARVSSREMK